MRSKTAQVGEAYSRPLAANNRIEIGEPLLVLGRGRTLIFTSIVTSLLQP
jgi:hypothetical protein